MKNFALNPIRLDESEFKTDLGRGNFIFVGSGTDMFADDVNADWIKAVLALCAIHNENKYLFQTKAPWRFIEFESLFPKQTILGTTIESNRDYEISKAPKVMKRADSLCLLEAQGFETMVTIEPILDFDVDPLINLIKLANPTWVNIGADSKGHKLPEPSKEKLAEFIEKLEKETDVKLKSNLRRLT
jgi:DNA repair photolyase